MATDVVAKRTRRSLLAGALGGFAAWLSSGMARPVATRAANDESVILGQDNTETKTTRILNSGSGDHGNAFEAWDAAQTIGGGICVGGAGVAAESDSADGPALWARNQGGSTAVLGWSQTIGVEYGIRIPEKTGVYGRAIQDGGAVGVLGESTVGTGVWGQATSGAAGRFDAKSGGLALHVNGRLRIDKASGIAAIDAGEQAVKVTPGLDVTASSFVLLTPRSDIGSRRLWYTTDRGSNTFTIRISSPSAAKVTVGWLLLG